MIARFCLDMQTDIYIPNGMVYRTLEMERDGYSIKVYPPQQAVIDPYTLKSTSALSLDESVEGLAPIDHPKSSSIVFINKHSTFKCNILCVDFIKDQFARQRSSDPTATVDPPLRLVFAIANHILTGLRVLSRGQDIKPLSERSTLWRVEYLSDDGQQLPFDDKLFRKKFGGEFRWPIVAMSPNLWDATCALPFDFSQHTWDALILDAEALMPEVGPAIAVANAALEAFIPWALNELQEARKFAVPDLWYYIFNRNDWRQNPSILDQFGVFIKMITGRDLKTERPLLWEGLKNLRDVRNSFSHDGKPMLGNSEVTVQKAFELIGKAQEIIAWVEGVLPEKLRRPIYREHFEYTIIKPMDVVAKASLRSNPSE